MRWMIKQSSHHNLFSRLQRRCELRRTAVVYEQPSPVPVVAVIAVDWKKKPQSLNEKNETICTFRYILIHSFGSSSERNEMWNAGNKPGTSENIPYANRRDHQSYWLMWNHKCQCIWLSELHAWTYRLTQSSSCNITHIQTSNWITNNNQFDNRRLWLKSMDRKKYTEWKYKILDARAQVFAFQVNKNLWYQREWDIKGDTNGFMLWMWNWLGQSHEVNTRTHPIRQ